MSVGAEDTFANDLYTICWGSVELRPLIPKGVGILRGKRDRGRDHDPEGQICGRQPDQPRQSRFSAFPCDDQRPANAGLLLAPPLPCHRGIRLFGAALSWLERCRHGAEPQSRLAFQTAKRSVFVALSLKQPCKELNARMIAAKPILCASQRRSPGQDPAFRQILFRKSRPGRTPLGIDADAGGSDRLTKNANQLFSLPRS